MLILEASKVGVFKKTGSRVVIQPTASPSPVMLLYANPARQSVPRRHANLRWKLYLFSR